MQKENYAWFSYTYIHSSKKTKLLVVCRNLKIISFERCSALLSFVWSGTQSLLIWPFVQLPLFTKKVLGAVAYLTFSQNYILNGPVQCVLMHIHETNAKLLLKSSSCLCVPAITNISLKTEKKEESLIDWGEPSSFQPKDQAQQVSVKLSFLSILQCNGSKAVT